MGNEACSCGGPQKHAVPPATVQTDIDVAKLVLLPRPPRFPSPGRQEERTSGECLLFLDQVDNLAYCGRPASLNCQYPVSEGRGHPWVRAWVQDKDCSVIGKVADWPAKSSNTNPAWRSTRELGMPFSARDGASLCLEVRDSGTRLGSLAIPLRGLPVHLHVVHELENRIEEVIQGVPSTVSFQLLDSSSFQERRVVYFVRHGESVWNQAQDSMQFHEMARTTDHPLSARGRDQAEALSRRLAKDAKRASVVAAEMLRPDIVFVSPLTRAIQTAVIALGPTILSQGGPIEIALMASAREKQNFGGLDTMSTKLGIEVLQNTLEELRQLYAGMDDCAVLGYFSHLRFDTQDVQDHWWCEGAAESQAKLESRMQDFLAQLLYSPCRSMVVVGHSHFFRAVFKRYLSMNFRADHDEFAEELSTKKLMNCGVARVELDPQRGISGGPIVGVELVLGTNLVSDDRASLLACCTAGHDESLSELQGPSLSLREEICSHDDVCFEFTPEPVAPSAVNLKDQCHTTEVPGTVYIKA